MFVLALTGSFPDVPGSFLTVPIAHAEELSQVVERHLAVGQRQLSKGRFAEAVEEFQAVLQLIPNHPEAQLLLAKALQGKATADAEAARERMRQVIDQHLLAGEHLLEEGDCAAAQERFRAILTLDANHDGAKRLLAKAEREAEEQRVKAEAQRRQRVLDAYLEAGDALMDRRAYPDAIEQYQQALDVDKNNRAARQSIEKAQRAIEKQRADAERAKRLQAAQEAAAARARAKLEEAARVARLRDAVSERVEAGRRLMRQGQYDGAVEQFQAALQLDAKDTGARKELSKAQHALDVRQRELEAARRTQEAEEAQAKAEAERQAREAREAEAARQEALQMQQAIAGHLASGRQLLAQGQFDEAQAEGRAVLKLDPKDAEAAQLMAVAKAGQQQAAQQAREAAARRDREARLKRKVEQALAQGKRSLERGDYDKAVEEFREVLQLGPHAEAAQLITKAEQGQRLAQARKALTDRQRTVEKQLAEGKRLASRGEWAAAAERFQAALQADPSHPEAKALLQQARQAQQATGAEERLKLARAAQTTQEEKAQQEKTQRASRLLQQHLASGKAALAQGQYGDASQQFQRALQLDSGNREAAEGLARAEQLGRTETQRLRQAQSMEDTKAESARTELEQQARGVQMRLERQARDLAKRLARDKEQARAQEALEQQRNVSTALEREQRLKTLYDRGVALYQQGNYEGAVGVFDQMAGIDPAHKLVQASSWLKDRASARLAEAKAREQQLAAKRMDVERLVDQARQASGAGRYEEALARLEEATVKDPGNTRLQRLVEQMETAKLKADERRLQAQVDRDEITMAAFERQVERDEQRMMNDVLQAEVLPEAKVKRLDAPAMGRGGVDRAAIAKKLRQPVSLDFTDVPLGDVLSFLAESAGVSIIPSPQLDLKNRRVSLRATDLPLEVALKYLAKGQELAYRIEPDAIVVATAEEFESQPLETRVFGLHSGLGPYALEASAVQANPILELQSIKQLVEQTVPQPSGSKIVVDERSGALIVTNSGENLELVDQLLAQLDVAPLQVLIEGRFMELRVNELDQLGLEAVLTGDVDLTKKKQPDGTLGPGHQIAQGGGEQFNDQDRQDEGLNLTLEGVLTGTQFEAVLHLLEESQKTKTLSAPRVTTLNNRSATIRVVDEFRYPTRYQVSLIQFDINGDGDFDDAGETEFANVPQDFKERDVGILLHVTPSVGKDMKTITLVLAPEVSQFSEFRDLGGGVVVPEFTTSQLTTSVIIEDGQTVVLGGLMQDTTTEELDKVPVLGDIPVVGKLFQQRGKTSDRRNLLIFITAKILPPRAQTT